MLCDPRPVRALAVLYSILILPLGGVTGCGEAPSPGPEGPVADAPASTPEPEEVPPAAEPEKPPAVAEPEAEPAAAGKQEEQEDERTAAARATELFERASVKEKAKDIDGALADYTKALELKPDYVQALYYRAGLRYRKGDADGAIADLTKAIELKPEYAFAYTGRGYVHQSEGRKGPARSDYVRAATLDPDGEAGRIARKNLKLLDER